MRVIPRREWYSTLHTDSPRRPSERPFDHDMDSVRPLLFNHIPDTAAREKREMNLRIYRERYRDELFRMNYLYFISVCRQIRHMGVLYAYDSVRLWRPRVRHQ